MLAHHGHGSKPCPLCDENNLDPNPIEHLLRVHQHEIGLDRTPVDSVDQLVTQIADCNIHFLYKFRTLVLPFWVLYTVVPLVGLYRWTLNLEHWFWSSCFVRKFSCACRLPGLWLMQIFVLCKCTHANSQFSKGLAVFVVAAIPSYLHTTLSAGPAAMVRPVRPWPYEGEKMASILIYACVLEWPLRPVRRSLEGLHCTFSSLQASIVATRELRLLNFLYV